MQVSVQIQSSTCANAPPQGQKLWLNPTFSNRQHRLERKPVTTSKLLIGLSLTRVKGDTVDDNIETSTCNGFGLLKGSRILR